MSVSRRIVTVGFEIPGGLSEYVEFTSKTSLLDYEVVLFRPHIGDFQWASDSYKGRPSHDSGQSVRLREAAAHWKRELAEAVRAGKTVVVLLCPNQHVYIDTGRREYSGTGRNRQTTQVVEPFESYQMLPFALSATTSKGQSMVLTSKAEVVAQYWKEFGPLSRYEVLLDGNMGQPLIVTTSGKKAVGAAARLKGLDGTVVLLPNIDLEQDEFYAEDDETGEMHWTEEGRAFGGKFREALLHIDSLLREQNLSTPPPAWAAETEFVLPKEQGLREELLQIESQLEELRSQQQRLSESIAGEGSLRRLLFEKGHLLEGAIRSGLDLLGFAAKPYRDSDSEFDVVFEAEEGRFIGEAEGKDSKAVNIDKLRQLESNLLEDFSREGVTEMATGVLFGNAFRLSPPAERGSFFTEKVVSAAARNGTVLVRTPDLFRVARYLSGISDTTFAAACRNAILHSTGRIVEFPDPPVQAGPPKTIGHTETSTGAT